MNEWSGKTYVSIMEAIVVALVGALLCTLINVPLPWLLGPLTAVMVWGLVTGRTLYWPSAFRQMALICLGYMLGSAFTRETAVQIFQQLPYMALTTILTVAVSLWLGALTARRAQTGIVSGLFGSVPGGLTQMIVLSEEVKGAEATVVVFMQTIRVLSVVFFVPFLTIHGIGGSNPNSLFPALPNPNTAILPWYDYIFYAAVPIAGAWAGKRIGLPNSILTGPLLATAFVMMMGKHAAPHLPGSLILLSQFAIGINIGLQVKPSMLKDVKKLGAYTIGGSLVLILFSFLLAFGLTMITPMTLTTAFLSTAPGGIAEMGVTAKMIHADLSMVSGYQLFRVFFIMFFIPPLLQWWIRKREKNHTLGKHESQSL